MQLVGKVALVTVQQDRPRHRDGVARAGADVGVNYLDDRAAAERSPRDPRDGRRAALPGDASRASDAEATVGASRELGAPGILVNNAGVFCASISWP
jgi:3-oxoacyl-[acyl-carrier protein] reductase